MISSLKAWWNKPYSDDMSAPQWFAFFGLIIVISVLWGLLLREIRLVAGE